MAKCESCKWNVDEKDSRASGHAREQETRASNRARDCALGLDADRCDGYAKPVEESCRQCEYHLGRGQCKLNLERECAEDHYGMYTLARAVTRGCGECDSFRGGRCVKGKEPEAFCMDYSSWPKVPNWGTEA